MKSSKPSFTQTLQKALQLDFFSDLFGNTSEQKARPEPISNESTATNGKTDGQRRKILIQDQVLDYELRRSKRRSIGFLIADEGLRVTAPRWVTLAQIEQALQEKQNWIVAKLREKREQQTKRMQPKMKWEDGAQLSYLGAPLTLRIASGLQMAVSHDQEQKSLSICLPPEASEQQLKDRVQSWLQQEAKRIFNARLPVFAQNLGVRYHSMSLSSATTRWGSCTSEGKIRLNWRLIHFSPEIIDYVVAHELSHLREMNHSADFWATVESVLPDYEIAKKKLRLHIAADLAVF